MIQHTALGNTAFKRSKALKLLINACQVQLAGNRKLKIYGSLQCKSGKRMVPQNRVFFKDEAEALQTGYRPCGHCTPLAYHKWKLAKF